jgi:hypothetical protein
VANVMRCGTAPASKTMRVWSVVPEAMLVTAQAASYCGVSESRECTDNAETKVPDNMMHRMSTIRELPISV